MASDLRKTYVLSDQRTQFRLSAENPEKFDVLQALVARHAQDSTLVIGQYLDQLGEAARRIDAPLITGKTPKDERLRLYGLFRDGEIRTLIVSKVGNFAVDLPEARVIIQLSGTFGSRQEEAQRLGRVLRPKADGRGALFYTLVTGESVEQEFAQHRQLFLTEQGYAYRIVDSRSLATDADACEVRERRA